MKLQVTASAYIKAFTEPKAGRVSVETNLPSGAVTTFAVDPRTEGQHTQATITTALETREGLLGLLERFLTTVTLRRIYVEELRLLVARAEEHSLAPRVSADKAVV